MDVIFSIRLIVLFSFIGEVLTWIERKDKTFMFGYVSVIRILTIVFSICVICCINN